MMVYWKEGMYLAALKAGAEMADFVGDTKSRKEYEELFAKGYRWTKENLFNWKYFYQKTDIRCKDDVEHFNCSDYWNEEKQEIKYQIADGCEIDQMLGQWHANLCGLGNIFDKDQRRTALQHLYQNNFKTSFRDFANAWRIFTLNDESGTVMCDYPFGSRKTEIPIPYCEECMTGFEYAFAGLLISEGFQQGGLEVVRAVRGRYDGKKRNPWNEIECGSNYARAMSAFALLPIFSGFEYDVPKGYLGFSPILKGDYKCFWSLGTGWGDFIRTEEEDILKIQEGNLTLHCLKLKDCGNVRRVIADGQNVEFMQEGECLRFPTLIIREKLIVRK